MSTDEAALVELAKTDREAFGQLYERYVDKIYSYIYYRTGNVADAEDLTARVFFRALQNIERYEDRGYPFSAWLYRIAHNLVANWHRDHSRHPVIALDNLSFWRVQEDGPERAATVADDCERLLGLVQQLPADRQQLLILKFVEQMTNAEIGQVMGRSEGAIKSLYFRTLRALRGKMDRSVPVEEPAAERPRSFWQRFQRETG